MKKLGFFGMLALMAITFTACPGPIEPPIDEVVEDGFYVIGEATAISSLTADGAVKGLMAAGTNEVDKTKRPGMYEKYIALEGGKDFELVLREGTSEVRYGAVLELSDTLEGDNVPQIPVYQGVMAENTKMRVAESGLYHIILDLNTNGDLSNKLIMVVPVEWGVRGAMNGWGYTAMTASAFNKTSMTFEIDCTVEAAGQFKFAHSNGWKFQLDQAGLVKAENNLGSNAEADGGEYTSLLPGGKNLPIGRAEWKLKLTWNLAGGALEKSFVYELIKIKDLEVVDPSTFVVGFSGSAFDAPAPTWGDPTEGSTLAVYNAEKSSITDATTKAGTYVYEISNLKFNAAGEFKVRVNGAWIGVGGATIVGATFTGTDNFIVGQEAVYDVEFSVAWDGAAGVTTVTFTEAAK